MHIDQLVIKSNIRDYIALFNNDDAYINKLSLLENSVYVIDKKVWDLYKDCLFKSIPQERIVLQDALEEQKNIDSVCLLYKKIMAYKPKKNLNLISIGGGIVQDITGFVASSLYRGINWIFVPTTFLAQIDSCIGAKTSLNFLKYKNLIGTFYPPSKIHISSKFLRTLSSTDYYSGIGEMAKLFLLDSKDSAFAFCKILDKLDKIDEQTVLQASQKCLKIKQAYIENDEFDTGKRNMLNFGHCFGHAIESATNFAIPHGLAVVVGMIIANQESCRRGHLSKDHEFFLRTNVLLPILKYDLETININTEQVVNAMGHDKKNTGNGLALIIINDEHQASKITLTNNEAIAALENFLRKN